MALRTTEQRVKDILGGDYDTVARPSLLIRIQTASIMVDDLRISAAVDNVTINVAKLELIEAHLAAHLYCISDKPYTTRSNGKTSGSFVGQTGLKLEATQYGQTALLLDSSGYLTVIDKRQVAGGFWGGVDLDIAYNTP